MIRKLAIVAALAFIITFSIRNTPEAYAAPASYTSDYLLTNMYHGYTNLYEFSGLDTTAAYAWFVDLVNDQGVTTQRVMTVTSVGSATFGFSILSGSIGPFPPDYTGAYVVRDNYSNILGRHYIMPTPHAEWNDSNGAQAENLKQVMGVPRGTNSTCHSPAYNDLNADGYHHASDEPCGVTINPIQDGYFVLHYNSNFADYGDDDTIRIRHWGNSSSTLMDINLDELADYNYGGHSAGQSDFNTYNFVLVNTKDILLPFVDNARSAGIFTAASDPHRATVDDGFEWELGVYGCVRHEHDTVPFTRVSDCESLLLMSDNVSITPWNHTEWIVDAQVDPVETGDSQNVNFIQFTEEIWNTFNDAWLAEDTANSYSDAVVYLYSFQRGDSYVVSAAAGEGMITWEVTPQTIQEGLGTIGIDPEDFTFIVADAYEIFDAGDLPGSVGADSRDFLERIGLDSPMGNAFALVFVLLAGLSMTAKVTRNPMAQAVVFCTIGALFIIMGFATLLTTVVFVGMALLVILWALNQKGTGDNASL